MAVSLVAGPWSFHPAKKISKKQIRDNYNGPTFWDAEELLERFGKALGRQQRADKEG